MPPSRRARVSSSTQSPLTFTSKVTKPSSSTPSTKSKLSTTLTHLPSSPTSTKAKAQSASLDHLTSSSLELQKIQAGEKEEDTKTEEELKAEKVTDREIKKYWREREAERKYGRIHQEGLSVEEKVLRLWDMSSQYGPAIGITRQKRWNRANKLGLHPPIEVLAILIKEEKKGNGKIERAHVDELMSSKFVVGEA